MAGSTSASAPPTPFSSLFPPSPRCSLGRRARSENFGKFKFFHACTLLLALTFLGIKSYEYYDKWIHYEIKLQDGTFADGHLIEKSPDFDLAKKTGTFTIHGRIVTDEKLTSTICARRKTSS